MNKQELIDKYYKRLWFDDNCSEWYKIISDLIDEVLKVAFEKAELEKYCSDSDGCHCEKNNETETYKDMYCKSIRISEQSILKSLDDEKIE